MANTLKEKELKTDWPITEGLTAETEKQTGREMTLIATDGSLVPRRYKAGMID